MTPFPLSRSDRNTKILITMFLLMMVIAFGVAELNIYDKVGQIKNGVVLRYGPDKIESAPPTNLDAPPPTEQPSIENEVLVARMNTFSALLDITHPHIFEIPLMVFVLAHFLMRTRVAEWFKLVNYLISFFGTTSFIAAPWLVRYVSIKLAVFLYIGAIMLGLSSLVMIVVPIIDMWWPATTKKKAVEYAVPPPPV